MPVSSTAASWGGIAEQERSVAAPRPTLQGLGSVALTWSLSNSTVYSGAPALTYPLGPEQVLYVPANRTLWTAFGAPSPGGTYNLTLWNSTDGLSVIVPGIGPVAGWTYSPSLETVFLTEALRGATSGELLALGTNDPDLRRPPLPLPYYPAAVAQDPTTGELWVAGPSNTVGPGTLTIASSSSNTILSNRTLGMEPIALAFDAAAQLGFVADGRSGNISFWNSSTGVLARQVSSGVLLGAMAYDDVAGQLLAVGHVGSSPSSWLVRIDPATGAVLNRTPLPLPEIPTSIGVDPTTGVALVAAASLTGSGGELATWNPATGDSKAIAPLGNDPTVQSFDPATGVDYVGHQGQVYVTAVNVTPGAVRVGVIEFGGGPAQSVYDPVDGRTYVVDSYQNTAGDGTGPDLVFAVDTQRGSPAEPVALTANGAPTIAANLTGIAVDPSSARIFVAAHDWSCAFALAASGGAFLANLSLPFRPVSVADDAARGLVYFGSADGRIVGFRASDLTETFNGSVNGSSTSGLSVPARSLAVVPWTGDLALAYEVPGAAQARLWVGDPTNGTGFNVTLASGNGTAPSSIVIDPIDEDAYVGSNNGAVYAVNLSNGTVDATAGGIPTRDPVSLAWDPGRDAVVEVRGSSEVLTLFNGSSPAGLSSPGASLVVGRNASGLSVVTGTDGIVVSEYGSGTVQLVSPVPRAVALTVHREFPTVGPSVAPLPVDDVNQPVAFELLGGGGLPPDTVHYDGLPAGCESTNASGLICYPGRTGSYNVTAVLGDAAGQSSSATAMLLVVPDPSATLRASPARVDGASASVNFTLTSAGGVAPFQYAVDSGIPGNAILRERSANSTVRFSVVFPEDGVFVATAAVFDSLGVRNSSSASVELRPAMTGTMEVGPAAGRPVPGVPVPFDVRVWGGFAPYAYSVACGGAGPTSGNSTTGNSTTVDCAFEFPGPNTVVVWVKDPTNATLRLQANVSVAAPPPGPFGEGAGTSQAVLPLAIVGVVGGIVAWVARRRGRTPPRSA